MVIDNIWKLNKRRTFVINQLKFHPYSLEDNKPLDLQIKLKEHQADLQQKKNVARKSGDVAKFFAGQVRLAIYPIMDTKHKIYGYEMQLIKGDAKNPELLG